MNASAAKLNAMAKRPAIDVVDSTSNVSTWRILDAKASGKTSMNYPTDDNIHGRRLMIWGFQAF